MNGQDSQIAHHRNLKEQASANVSAFIFNKDKYSANERAYLQGLHDIATKGRVTIYVPIIPQAMLANRLPSRACWKNV
jgi:hypothetical protein